MVKSNTTKLSWAEQKDNAAISEDTHRKLDFPGFRQTGDLRRKDLRRRGMALIWVAIFLLLLILFIGLMLDTAKAVLAAHQLQNAADAGALAGAQFVKYDQVTARQQTIDIAFENYADGLPVSLRDNVGNDPNLDVVIGRYLRQTQTFTPTLINPNAVKAVARRIEGLGESAPPVSLNFGPIANVDTVDITRDAIAMSSGSTGAGLIALDEYPTPKKTGLQVGGNSIVQVNDGDIQVNSWSEDNPWTSFRAMGDFTLQCEELNVRGTVNPDIEHEYWQDIDYSVNENTGPLPDPLEHLPDLSPLPAMTAQWGEQTINSSVITSQGVWSDEDEAYLLTLEPGYYPGGINMTVSNCKLVLQPGIYALGGTRTVIDPNSGELLVKGGDTGLCINGGTFIAEGVMFYITESLEGKCGVVDIHGGTHVYVKITEYQSSDPETDPYGIYHGMAIFQDRANTEESYVTGSTEVFLEGTLYFKHANFRVGGDGLQAGTQLIAGTVEVDGGSYVIINYDGRNWVVGNKSFIVK